MFILYVCLIVFDVVSQEPNKQNKIKKKSFVEISLPVPEKKIFEGFLPYIGLVAILVM